MLCDIARRLVYLCFCSVIFLLSSLSLIDLFRIDVWLCLNREPKAIRLVLVVGSPMFCFLFFIWTLGEATPPRNYCRLCPPSDTQLISSQNSSPSTNTPGTFSAGRTGPTGLSPVEQQSISTELIFSVLLPRSFPWCWLWKCPWSSSLASAFPPWSW